MVTRATIMGGRTGPSIASAQAGQVVVQHSKIELTVAEVESSTFIARFMKLPAQHRIVSLVVFNDDLDGTTGAAVDIGIQDDVQDPSDTSDLTLFAAAQDMQTAATITRLETEAMWEYAAANYDRFVEMAIETVAGTGLVGGVSMVLTTRPELGAQFEG